MVALKCRRLCGTHEGARVWLNVDICGLICGSLTWFLLFYGSYASTYFIIFPWMNSSWIAYLNILIFNLLVIMAIYSHIMTMTTDPGAVPKTALPLFDDQQENDHEENKKQINGLEKFKKLCKRCRHFKPIRAHHCSMCGRCIIKMDHHCPWVNNCVGIGNHKLFIVFLFWVNIVCWYALALIIGRVLSCWMYAKGESNCFDVQTNMGVIFLFMESMLFLLFTSCMMADQMSGILLNQTQIDRLKNEQHHVSADINEVFGSPIETKFQLSWILPVPVSYPPSLRDKLLGYRLVEPPSPDSDLDEETDALISGTRLSEEAEKPAVLLNGRASEAEVAVTAPTAERPGRYERCDSGGSGTASIRKRVSPLPQVISV